MRPAQLENYYQPEGAAKEIFRCKDRELLFSGPVRTGKSLALLNKLYALACHYAGMRGLIVRKTRASLTETGLVTWENEVIPPGSHLLKGSQRASRQAYHFNNGSVIVVGGMDKTEKIMSSQYDFIYCQEATELRQDEWEALTTRLSHGVMPYQQIAGDCNPDAPSHWLMKRHRQGVLKVFEARFEDNPRWYDLAKKEWTEAGRIYLEGLRRSLSGVRYDRMYRGLWVAAEGGVYSDVWQPATHIIDRFDIPAEWPRYWSVDFGFVNPFVWSAYAQDHDGRLYRYKEIYMTQRLVEDHARQILQATQGEPKPAAIVCDHDAEGRATLERYLGMRTVPAFKQVQAGIQAVAARLRVAEDGKARLYFLRDSLLERDQALEEAKKPCETAEEIEGYVWNTSTGQRKGEDPVKQDDHGCDAMRYVVAHLDLNQKRSIKFY